MPKAELSRRAVLAGLAASPAAMEFLRSAIAEAQTNLSQSGLVGEFQGPLELCPRRAETQQQTC